MQTALPKFVGVDRHCRPRGKVWGMGQEGVGLGKEGSEDVLRLTADKMGCYSQTDRGT